MTYTFSGIQTELKNQLSLLSGWANILYYGVYQRIIDAIAFITYKTCYLGYYLYKESCWSTAEKARSLNQMSWMLNYFAHRKIGAEGSIILSADPTFSAGYMYQGKSVAISKWTKFCDTSKNVNVYSTEAHTYFTGTIGNLTINVKEGTPKEFTYIANGVVGEKIYIYSDKIENDYIDVYIIDDNGDVLNNVTIVSNTYLIDDPDNYYCTVTNSPDFNYIYLTFGNGVCCKQLSAGAKVLIKYAETLGDQGNIQNTGRVTKINSILYDSDGGTVNNLYVTNTASIVGGDTYEDIESIRNNAPNLFGAGYRCGTKSDWDSVLNSFNYIYKARAWTITDMGGSTLLSDQNKVYITALDSEGDILSNEYQTQLVESLEADFSSPTEVIEFYPSTKVYLSFEVTGSYSNSTANIVSTLIKDAYFSEYYVLNSDFNRKIYQNEYVSILSYITALKQYEVNVKMMDYDLGKAQVDKTFNGYYSSAISTEKVLVTQGSPTLWIKRKISGVWQPPLQIGFASGPFIVGMNGYTLNSTNLDYTEYKYSFVIKNILDTPGDYGVSNPTEDDQDGYITAMIYATMDGNGDQQESVRLQSQYAITSIDEDFIFTTLTEI